MVRVSAQRGKGGFRYTEFGPMIQSDPERARARLRAALARHGDNQVQTAKALGVPPRTLGRWLSKLAGLGFRVLDEPAEKTS